MSGIDNAKKAANWQHPNERRGCLSCRHGFQDAKSDGFCGPTWRCGELGMFTHRHAVCDKWAERKVRK